jgi:uridine phosphorylase
MGCRQGDIAPAVVLVARAEQAQQLAKQLDNAHTAAARREYITITGTHNGRTVSICSTGFGSPPLAIAVEEIRMVGGETLIWLGEIHPLAHVDPHVELSDVVVAWAAVREEYTTRQYVPLAYPALADHRIAMALERVTGENELKSQLGVVLTTDLPTTRTANFSPGEPAMEAYRQAGVLGSEMGISTLFVTARLLGLRAGALLRMAGRNSVTDNTLMQVCLGTLERLESGEIWPTTSATGDMNEP